MRESTSRQTVFVSISDLYFTSCDLDSFEFVLSQAMAVLEMTDTFGQDDDMRRTTRLRLAAAIIRRASVGERNPATLLRAALDAAPRSGPGFIPNPHIGSAITGSVVVVEKCAD